ncbi:hotdog fold thioesterase [bacterium]|nr:hotdog fold thioesterase [bacterium]
MSPEAIVTEMLRKDAFSRWLGIELLELAPGHCRLKASVTPTHCNGFEIAHGGIAYALADSALAFAANSHGWHAVSIETSIAHTRPVVPGQTVFATARELQRSKQFGRYTVTLIDEGDRTIALFHGTVFFKETPWSPLSP